MAGWTGNYYYNILHFTTGATSGKAGHLSPALYLHGGNWWSGPGIKAGIDGKPSSIYGRLHSIQRNRIYHVLLTQTKHLDKVSSVKQICTKGRLTFPKMYDNDNLLSS